FQFNLSRGSSPAEAKASQASSGDRVALRIPASTTTATVKSQNEYVEFQLTSQASPKADNVRPRYPDALRAANVEGDVLAQFIVDETGTVDPRTFRVLRTTDPQFTDAVRQALPMMRFNPAEAGGRHVKQLLTMPFTFRLSK